MDTRLLVSTALVSPQVGSQPPSEASPSGTMAVARAAGAETLSTSGKGANAQAAERLAVDGEGARPAATGQGAPNSALTTYRDQDSGRLIVRVYDRESGDVLVEFPPEKAFRPVGGTVTSPVAKAKTSFSV